MHLQIMFETVAGFDWDEGNLEKCQKRGVSVAAIQGLFARPHTIRVDLEHSLAEERLRAIGKTDRGRYVFLVFTIVHLSEALECLGASVDAKRLTLLTSSCA